MKKSICAPQQGLFVPRDFTVTVLVIRRYPSILVPVIVVFLVAVAVDAGNPAKHSENMHDDVYGTAEAKTCIFYCAIPEMRFLLSFGCTFDSAFKLDMPLLTQMFCILSVKQSFLLYSVNTTLIIRSQFSIQIFYHVDVDLNQAVFISEVNLELRQTTA